MIGQTASDYRIEFKPHVATIFSQSQHKCRSTSLVGAGFRERVWPIKTVRFYPFPDTCREHPFHPMIGRLDA